MVKELKDPARRVSDRNTRIFFVVFIIAFTFILYGNTVRNGYSLDDYIIQGVDTELSGNFLKSLSEIFTTTYTTVNTGDGIEKSFGYRPVVRLVFAVEYAIFGARPGIGHFINILFYLAVVLLLYRILQRIFRGYNIWFPFVITLLFMAHPVHTEVVASLKNRDELISMLLSLLTLLLLLKYSDRGRTRHLLLGLFLYVLAFLSKPTALAFWLVFPLTLYFFTGMKIRRILLITGLITLMIVIGGMMPFWFLDRVRDVSMVDNPLYFEDNFWNILGTGMYSLLYYLRLLAVPHPLLYYYGYDMIPVVNLANPWVVLSILLHLALLGIAILKFREKHVISYAILFYLLTIAMYSNIVQPVPGIIGERFLLVPSIAFAMALAWVLFMIFKAVPTSTSIRASRIFFVTVFTVLILIPYTWKTIDRNRDWASEISLFRADEKHLDRSVKAHDLMGTIIMRNVERELAKQVNVAKFLMPQIRQSIGHFESAVEIWPGHASSWKNLGMIYNNPRIAEHFLASGDTLEYLHFKKKAVSSFKQALVLEPGDGKALFNLGFTYENTGRMDSAMFYYEKCIRHNPGIINPRSRLADLKFMMGDVQEAIRLNREIIRIDPMEALPYVSFGNYYMIMGDTLKAIESYEEAAKRNTRPEVFAFLAEYYSGEGNEEKARYYRNLYNQATRPQP